MVFQPSSTVKRPTLAEANERIKVRASRMGGPTLFTPEKGRLICDLVSAGVKMQDVAEEIGGDLSTIYDWMHNSKCPENVAFAEAYEQAKKAQAQLWLELANEAIQDKSDDLIVNTDRFGTKTSLPNSARIGRDKLKAEVYKWRAALADEDLSDGARKREVKELKERLLELESKTKSR